MLCFVDESGDPGLKTDIGSSKYFTVALVLFEDNEEAIACDKRINKLRSDLNLAVDYEFRFSKISERRKIEFFNSVLPFNFFYLAVTINKSALYGEGFKYKNSFYKYTCSLVFENAKAYLDNATVIFDGSGSRKFKFELQQYLKKKINEKGMLKIKKVKLQDSHKNNLIQLADMVCGAIGYSYKGKEKYPIKFRQMLSHREIFCQVWPKKINENKKKEYSRKKKK